MKRTFYILILLSSIPILAQKTNKIENESDDYITTDLFSPFYLEGSLGGFSGIRVPRWRIGYIKNINSKTKIGIDLGYGNTNISIIPTLDNYSLWEIRPEFYHILKPKKKHLNYFSLEFFYLNEQQVFEQQEFISSQHQYFQFEKADYQRQKFGIIPKYGMFINFSKKVGINWYTGIGVNYRINSYSDFVNLSQLSDYEEHFSPYYRKEGNKIGIEFTLGLKIYYRIKN